MRAARALAGWEQSDLAQASGLSIATVRKIEQGGIGMRPSTEAKFMAAFAEAGIQLIPEDRDGGAGVRYKEKEMTEEMRAYFDLRNKIKGYFIYELGREDGDDDEVGCMVDEVAHEYLVPNLPSLSETLKRWGLPTLPPQLVEDLTKLGEMEADIGTRHWEKVLAQEGILPDDDKAWGE